MTTTATVLLESKIAVATTTTQYTSTGLVTIIDKFTSTNYDTVPRTLSVYLVPSGSTAGTTNLMRAKTLPAGAAYEWPEVVGHVLKDGDFIATLSSNATGVNIRASGRQIT